MITGSGEGALISRQTYLRHKMPALHLSAAKEVCLTETDDRKEEKKLCLRIRVGLKTMIKAP